MKLRITIIFVVCMFMPALLLAQSLTNKEKRKINSQVLSVVEEYERYASLYDDNVVERFSMLFTDEAHIQSDIMGSSSYLKSISVSEYIDQMKRNSVSTVIIVKDVIKGDIQYDNGNWIIPVSFKKLMHYIDDNGYIFSFNNFYSSDISVRMSLIYNEDEDCCLIDSIECDIDSDKVFPEGRFYIIDRRAKGVDYVYYNQVSNLMVDNAPVEFDESDLAFVPQGGEFSVYDTDVNVKYNTVLESQNYDVISFTFKSHKNRVKPYFSWAPFYAYSVTSNTPLSTTSSAMNVGVDYGRTILTGKNAKMGIYIGAGVSMSNLNLSVNKNNSYVDNLSRLDKNSAVVNFPLFNYDKVRATESVQCLDLYVPLYLGFEFRMGRNLLLSFDIGAKGYMNLSTKAVSPYSVEYSLNSGEKPLFTPLSFIVPNKSYKRTPFDVSAIANIGLDVNLYKGRIYWMIGAGYEYGLTESRVLNISTLCAEDTNIKPIVLGVNTEGSAQANNIAVNSLIGGVATKRNAIWFTTGLKFKL